MKIKKRPSCFSCFFKSQDAILWDRILGPITGIISKLLTHKLFPELEKQTARLLWHLPSLPGSFSLCVSSVVALGTLNSLYGSPRLKGFSPMSGTDKILVVAVLLFLTYSKPPSVTQRPAQLQGEGACTALLDEEGERV
jgi:hypothetical protein